MYDDVYTLIVLYIVLYIYIPIKGTISVSKTETAAAGASNINQKLILKNCATFTDCVYLINYTQIDNAKKTLM